MPSASIAQAVQNAAWTRSLISLVFPKRCAVCTEPTNSGAAVCAVCTCSLDRPLTDEVEASIEKFCPPSLLDGVFAVWVFEKQGPIQKVHRAIKYANQPFLGSAVGQMMAYEAVRRGWPVDMVVPIPLHRLRYVERGYNQAGDMAQSAARTLRARYRPKALRRQRATMTQTRLGAEDRAQNVAGVLETCSRSFVGAHVLIVDDVITSGATMSAAASAVRSAGATRIFACAMGFARR